MNEQIATRAQEMRGVDAIRQGWDVIPLKTFLRSKTERGNSDFQLLSVYRDHGVVPFGSIEGNHNKPSLDLSDYKTVRVGDLVLNKMKTWQGSLAISEYEGIVSPAYIVCKVSGSWDRRYLHHLLRSPSFIAEYASLSYGIRVGQWDMRFEDFREVLALHPPVDVQRSIVAYLDSETVRIDALIDRKQRFIDLLLEKRTALITHAVTKGLDSNVEMEDSGVPWLGFAPTQWVMRSFRSLARIRNGSDFKHIQVEDGGHPVYGSGGPFARASEYVYDRPSVLLGRKGTVDRPLYVDEPFWTVDTMFYTEIAPDVLPKFLYYLCTILPFDYFQNGSALPSMTQTDLYSLRLPVPCLREQVGIADYLDAATTAIDELVEVTRTSIDLLREYRTALISAAVTGQIDIPGTDETEDVA